MDILDQLKAPFPENAISWRVGATNSDKSKGIALAYIDARDVMRRFDDVMGINWQCRYTHVTPNGVVCEIGLKIDGEWLWRSNGAGETDVEGEKGALSDAFKRAAVLWGVGRYLYDLPNVWVEIENKRIKNPPALPEWAKPGGVSKSESKTDSLAVLVNSLQSNDPWSILKLSWDDEQGFRLAFGRLNSKQKSMCREMEQAASVQRNAYIEELNALAEADDLATMQFWDELPNQAAKELVWKGLTQKTKDFIKRNK